MECVFGALHFCPTSQHTAVRAGFYIGGAARVAIDLLEVWRSEKTYREEIRADVSPIVNPRAKKAAQNMEIRRRF